MRSKKGQSLTINVPAEWFEHGEDPLMLRQEMLSLSDDKGPVGGVDTCTGLGSDSIRLYWRDRVAIVRGRDLLKTWVAMFAPEDAKKLP